MNEHIKHLPQDVLKALTAAGQVAESIEREDLEAQLTRLNVLNTPLTEILEENAVLATAFEHEYTVETNRLDKPGFAAFRDGQLPRTVDVAVARRRIRPMLVGHRITVTELATRTTENGIIPIDDLVVQSKMIAVANEFEYLAFYGDGRLGGDTPGSPNNLQQDGIIEMVKRGAPQNVLDADGQPLSIDLLWQAEQKVVAAQAYANPTDVLISFIDKLNLQKSFYQIARTMTDAQRRAGLLGADAQTYIGIRGEHTLHPSQFLGDFHKFTPYGIGAASGEYARPAESFAVSAATAITGANSALTAGDYSYAFKVANFYGETGAKSVDATVANDGDAVSIDLTNLSDAKWVDVYRKDPGSDAYKFYKRVPLPTAATSYTFVDDGYESVSTPNGVYRWKKIPGTGVVIGIDRSYTTMAKWIGMEIYRLPPALTHDYVVWKVASPFSRAPEFNWLIVNVSQEPI